MNRNQIILYESLNKSNSLPCPIIGCEGKITHTVLFKEDDTEFDCCERCAKIYGNPQP